MGRVAKMRTRQQELRTTLDELRYLVSLNGSFLFVMNALVPLYPAGRITVAEAPGGSSPGPFTLEQVVVLIILAATGVAAIFLPLYIRLLVSALPAPAGKKGGALA